MDQKKSVYQRNDKIWPWGYYIPQGPGMKRGQWGLFVATTKEEALRQINRAR